MNAPAAPAHAILPPSSAARWEACAASVLMARRYPETEEDPTAREGTAAHWLATRLLPPYEIEDTQAITVAPNGVPITDEMRDGAEMYVDDVRSVVVPHDPLQFVHVEERVAIPRIHDECWGTPDLWYFNMNAGRLTVWDYKFGHRFVEAFENWQLIAYAAGILDRHMINGFTDQHTIVDLRVVQPRSYHRDGPVRNWTVPASDLRPYFNALANAAARALAPDPVARVNRECRDCTGRHACEALQRAALDAMDTATSSVPLMLPAPALGTELRRLQRARELLNARITGHEAQALALLKAGQRVPYFALEQGVGRERWARPIGEVLALGEMMGVELAQAPEAITPKQAIRAGLSPDVVRAYSEVPRGEIKLVPDEGKAARKAFAGGTA